MPSYLFEARYTHEGVRGLRKEGGSGRQDAIEELARSVGGRVDNFWFAFGDIDVYAILDLPDHESAAAIALAINADGRTHVRTVPLISPNEMDGAVKKSVSYRGPGG